MAKIDIPTKRLIQLRPEDWAKALLPEYEDIMVTEMKPDKHAKVESRLDALFWIEYKDERFVLNIEPQGYYESALPARMLRYRSDVWEYTMSTGRGIPSIKQVVVFFYPRDDNKVHRLEDKRNDHSNISYSYDVIKIWEMKKNYVIDNKLIGLYPLLPLMEVEPNETPDQIIEETVKIIETIESEALKGDVLAAMSILAVERYSSELIKKYVRREMLMNSPLFEEWVKEERDEAAKKARELATRDNIIEVLTQKFEFVSEDIIEELNNIKSLSMLNQLFTRSIKVTSLEEFNKFVKIVKR